MRTPEEIQTFVVEQLQARSPKARKTTLKPETSLVQTGILDSFAFLDLVADLETHFGVRLELENYDFEVISTLGGLCNAIASSA